MHRAKVTSAYYGNTQVNPYFDVKYALYTMSPLYANIVPGDSEHTITGGSGA